MNKLICSTCRKRKPETDFNRSTGKPRGRNYRCRQCAKEHKHHEDTGGFEGMYRRMANRKRD